MVHIVTTRVQRGTTIFLGVTTVTFFTICRVTRVTMVTFNVYHRGQLRCTIFTLHTCSTYTTPGTKNFNTMEVTITTSVYFFVVLLRGVGIKVVILFLRN